MSEPNALRSGTAPGDDGALAAMRHGFTSGAVVAVLARFMGLCREASGAAVVQHYVDGVISGRAGGKWE